MVDDDELGVLRARAYGPDADIQDDPDALRRLHELEALATTGSPRHAGHPADTGSEPSPRAVMTADAPPNPPVASTPESNPDVAPAPGAPLWWGEHRRLVWAVSLVVAALVGAGAAFAAQTPQPQPIALLAVDGTGEAPWPEQMWGTRPPDGVTFQGYFGLTAISTARDLGNGTSSSCLWVFDDGSVNFGLSSGSCAAGAFPATATVLVTLQAPRELREEFAEGTALQFVLEDREVRVYADLP